MTMGEEGMTRGLQWGMAIRGEGVEWEDNGVTGVAMVDCRWQRDDKRKTMGW